MTHRRAALTRRALRAIPLAAAGLLAAAPGAMAGPSPVITARPGGATIAGVTVPSTSTLGGMQAVWGDARIIPSGGPDMCRAEFASPGVSVVLANFGGGDACTPDGGLIDRLTTRGPWRTNRGLRVGDPQSRVKRLYPRAFSGPSFFVGGDRAWHLVPRREPCIGDCTSPTQLRSAVQAVVKNGRVRAFVVTVGAAGD